MMPLSMKYFLYTAIFFALISSGLHGYLSHRSYSLEADASSKSSICQVSDQINCDIALMSPYAKIFGMSISNWGIGLNLFLTAILLWLLFSPQALLLKRLSFSLSALSVLVSLGLFGISYVMKFYCPFCIGIYISSLVIMLSLAVFYQKEAFWPWSDLKSDLKNPVLISGLSSIVIIAVFFHMLFVSMFEIKSIKSYVQISLVDWQSEPKRNFKDISIASIGANREDAKMVIVEFLDFLCPHCKKLSTPVKVFLLSRKDVRLEIFSYPLDGSCNNSVPYKSNGYSCVLARHFFCAQKQGKEWNVHGLLFQYQEELLKAIKTNQKFKETLQGFISQANLDHKKHNLCVKDKKTHQSILKIANEGAGIPGTPTFFVNGKMIRGKFIVPYLEALYKQIP